MNRLEPPVVVMTIDDEPDNLNLLDDIFRLEGWDVRAFTRGLRALDAAREQPPDLVLLDIRMPEMDGFETCRRFKCDEALRAVPIIFLSANTESADKVRAFSAGCVDYVSKPFAAPEVLARARTQIQLHRHQASLEELVRARTRNLAEAHRRLSLWDDVKNDWINVLSHELRTPLTGILGVAELLFLSLPQDSDSGPLREAYEESRRRIDKLIDDAGMIVQIQAGTAFERLQPVALAGSLRQAADAYAEQQRTVPLSLDVDTCEPTMTAGIPELMRRAWTDLLLTAACCVGDGGSLSMRTEIADNRARVRIATTGVQLPVEALDSFFEVGGQRVLVKGGGDFGLGAALARRIIGLFDGRVAVENVPGRGVVIEAWLPVSAGAREIPEVTT